VATTIIDDMVNLQLMFGAANLTGVPSHFLTVHARVNYF
jgi:hypothetical protein